MKSNLFYDDFVCFASEEVDREDPNIKENCEYANTFGELQRQEKNFINTNEVYKRSWLQLINLVIGNGVLLFFLYKQK